MDKNFSENNFEYVVESEELSIERVSANGCSFDEANIILTTNNNTISVETDPLAIPLNVEVNYELKPCFVELTRCDNIWKTFQIIRDLQEDRNSECSEIDKVKVKQEKDDSLSSMNDDESYSLSTQTNNTMAPYIKYQPVLNNGNSALNFQFSVKSTRLLYQCHECGKQYSHRSTLREHSERIHNIILPIIRKKPENANNDKTIQSKGCNDFLENDVSKDEMSSTSTDNNENSANEIQDDGVIFDNSNDAHSSDKELLINSKCKIYQCLYCNRQYKDKYYFNHHLKHIHGTSIAGIRAYKKRSTENNGNQNNNDTNTQHSLVKTRKVQQIDQSRNLNVHRCDTCGKHFYNKRRLGDHLRKVHGIYSRNRINNRIRSNKSNNRKIKSTTTTNVKTKTNVDNNTRRIHHCTFCKKTYLDRPSWRKHMQSIHGVTFVSFCGLSKGQKHNFTCKECGRKYLWKRSLIEHLLNVHGQWLQHECDTCGLWFQSSDSLIKHALDIHKIMLTQRIIRRSKDKPHKCHICSTHYGLKKNLSWHLLEIHGIRNFDDLKNIKKEPTDIVEKKTEIKRQPAPLSHKIIRKGLRDKTRINYNEATESCSVEQLLLGDTMRNKENVEASEKINPNTVTCFLCQRRCIQIRRHFIEYHKIQDPDAIMAHCKPTSSVNVIDNNTMTDGEISKETKINVKIENVKQKMVSNSTRVHNYRNINPNRLFMKLMSSTGRATYKCKICPNYFRGNYELLRKHEKLHRRQEIPSPITESEIELHEMTNTRKRKRVSVDNRDTRRPRLSDSVESTRITRTSLKLKEEREFRCTVCDRLFRNAEILSSHKISCISYHGENSSMNDASDTRESSDRDSGIGISITIKKRNNSYEIVSREGNEEEKLTNCIEKSGELKDDASVSDNSSETFNTMTRNKSSTSSEKSNPYSINHMVVKLQKTEDNDVDIDLESMSKSPIYSTHEDKHHSVKPHRIPSLSQLCKNALAETKNNDKLLFECKVCSATWLSKAARNAHMKIHSKQTRL